MKNKEEKPNKDTAELKDAVLSRLQKEQIKPRSRLLCLASEYSIWTLWALSVVFGAVSLAVIQFASLRTGYAFYEATHESFWEFVLEALPYLWLGVFGLLTVAAYYNLRHTKKGYKYKFSHIILSSLGLSLIGGAGLHAVGVGYYLDTYAGQMSGLYESHEEMEIRLWQDPTAGRLVGEYAESDLLFVDESGEEWELELSDLHERDLDVLKTGEKVRVLGAKDEDTEKIFHVCGVFPWLTKRPPALSELREDRKEFVERIRSRKPEFKKRLEGKLAEISTSTKGDNYCEKMPVLKRIKPQ